MSAESPYKSANVETHPTFAAFARGAVVVPPSHEDGSIDGFGLLAPYAPPPIAQENTEHGTRWVNMVTGAEVMPPQRVDQRFVPKGTVEAKPAEQPTEAPVEAPAALPASKNRKSSVVKTPKKIAVTPEVTPAPRGKTVKVHAGGISLPIQYANAVVDEDRGLVVLVWKVGADVPEFSVREKAEDQIRLTIDGKTYTCSNVNLEYELDGMRHLALVMVN